MMRIALLSILIILSCLSALAQKNGSIKGQLYDSIAKQPVGAATVSVMDRSDSSLVSFTMTGNDGRFELKGIPNGQYRLLVTHVSYYNNNSNYNPNYCNNFIKVWKQRAGSYTNSKKTSKSWILFIYG